MNRSITASLAFFIASPGFRSSRYRFRSVAQNTCLYGSAAGTHRRMLPPHRVVCVLMTKCICLYFQLRLPGLPRNPDCIGNEISRGTQSGSPRPGGPKLSRRRQLYRQSFRLWHRSQSVSFRLLHHIEQSPASGPMDGLGIGPVCKYLFCSRFADLDLPVLSLIVHLAGIFIGHILNDVMFGAKRNAPDKFLQ